MPRGGKRPGAGRPALSESGATVVLSINVAPALADELRAVAAEAKKTHAAILAVGVQTEKARLARRKKAKS